MDKEFFKEKAEDLFFWSAEELLAAICWFSECGLLTIAWYLYCSLAGAAFFTLTLVLLVQSAGAATDSNGYLILSLITFLTAYEWLSRKLIFLDFDRWLAEKEAALEKKIGNSTKRT